MALTRLKGSNKQTAFRAIILADNGTDIAAYVPVNSDIGVIIIRKDTLETFRVVPGPALVSLKQLDPTINKTVRIVSGVSNAVLLTDGYVIADASANDVELVLPLLSTITNGQAFVLLCEAGFGLQNVTVVPNAGDGGAFFDGISATLLLDPNTRNSVTVVKTSIGWRIVNTSASIGDNGQIVPVSSFGRATNLSSSTGVLAAAPTFIVATAAGGEKGAPYVFTSAGELEIGALGGGMYEISVFGVIDAPAGSVIQFGPAALPSTSDLAIDVGTGSGAGTFFFIAASGNLFLGPGGNPGWVLVSSLAGTINWNSLTLFMRRIGKSF